MHTSHSDNVSPAIILRRTDRMCSEFQCCSSVMGLYRPVPPAVSIYCSKFCAGSRLAQHIRRSVCGLKYVCTQGAKHRVLGGEFIINQFCHFWCHNSKVLSSFAIKVCYLHSQHGTISTGASFHEINDAFKFPTIDVWHCS